MSELDERLHWAAYERHINKVVDLLRRGASANYSYDGWTPLHCAAFNGDCDVIIALVNANANIQATNDKGKTPLTLFEANYKKQHDDLTFGKRNSPLHVASRRGEEDNVKALVCLGAKFSVTNYEGKTPLELFEENCRKLYQPSYDRKGNSPLHLATSRGQENKVKALVCLGADLSARNHEVNCFCARIVTH
ncbi:ankyrin repeat and protein kinase domain-containing protein 1-like [Mytilus trossulus]|uniref:ankyrin repeat and protein kinase domain-containing protein 1-like n=1 Tax=Mytilus trossulus TaxID=6551 RepID=UPI0030070964